VEEYGLKAAVLRRIPPQDIVGGQPRVVPVWLHNE